MYVRKYVCMYISVYVCMYVRMYVQIIQDRCIGVSPVRAASPLDSVLQIGLTSGAVVCVYCGSGAGFLDHYWRASVLHMCMCPPTQCVQ